ncbi:MAG: TolC family protein [Desulfofustis sp.]|nr:TolC family protein [Desulfofustis sp.]
MNYPVHATILEKLMLSYPLQECCVWNGTSRSRVMQLRMRIRGLMSLVLLTVICMAGGARGGSIDHTPMVSVIDQPESLESAWIEAIASAHRLKGSHKTTEAAHESALAAKATRLPTVTAEGGYFLLDEAPSAIVSLPGLPGLSMAMDDHFWAGRVTAAVPLYTSGRISTGVKAAEAGWKAAQAEERREMLDLKLDVADAYVKVLRATQAVQIAASSVTSLTSHSHNVVNLFAKGFVAKTDLLASHVVLADARQREIQAQNSLDLASAGYNRFLVRPLTHAVRLKDLTPPLAAEDVSVLTERALQERPELVVLSEQNEALRQEAGSVRAGALPSVGVSGSYLHLENSVLERDHVWTVGLVGTWNIFDSGLTRHKARAVDNKADAVSALLAEATGVVSLQVRQFWLEVAETRLRLGVTADAVVQAEENLKVARDRYRTGTGTSTEVLDAETLRVLSLGNHNNAVYDAVMASFRLRRAVGDL